MDLGQPGEPENDLREAPRGPEKIGTGPGDVPREIPVPAEPEVGEGTVGVRRVRLSQESNSY